ncbi:MAG: 50S ribosomal protein L35 [Terriglobia bacterium]
MAKLKLKLKTHKGAAKRFKITATGKVIRGHAYARHILTSKSSNRKRKLDQTTTVSPSDVNRVRVMLPYGR